VNKSNCLKRLIFSIVTATVISIIILLAFEIFADSGIDFISVFFGWLISLLNIVSGTKYIMKAIDKNNRKFLVLVFGSMTIRLFLTMLVILVALLIFKLNDYYFIFSLLFYYFVFLIFEILFFNCRINYKKTELNSA